MKNQKTKIKQHKGLTIIEVIVATAVFAFFLGSVIAAIIADAHNGPANEKRLQAANLAREGVQLVTQIRDTAMLRGSRWNDLDTKNAERNCWGLYPGDKHLIQKIGGGPSLCSFKHWFLENGAEVPTGTFGRTINIANIDSSKKLVTVVVFWDEGGTSESFTMRKILSDWKIR